MATVEHCLLCFEALSAHLEKRTPMTLYQVRASWEAYPKGLEDEDDYDLSAASATSESEDDLPTSRPASSSPSTTKKSSSTLPRISALQRLSNRSGSSSNSSLPSSTSTSSTSLSAPSTSPDSTSTSPSFNPIGLHPRRTSQRSTTLTESPLFVTWNTIPPSSPTDRHLRGCIGTFSPEPLSTGIPSYALISSLQDHRFSPITLSELPSLEVSVTLLTDFETCREPLDWEVGVHGIRISFYARNKRYGACYLPDVMVEQEWGQEEAVISAMRKGGWNGRSEKWREVGDLKVTRFQGRAESVGWGEYKRWREWVEKGKEGGK